MTFPANPPGAVAADVAAASPKLQTLNYVNVLAYLFNFLVVFGSTKAGLPDNGTVSRKYQTLVTPAPYAFAIWGIIFTAELVWTILQMLPSYRSHELVIKGVGYNFALASFFQGLWMIGFGLEHIGLSLIAIIGILIPLLRIVTNTSSASSTTATTASDYWLLIFPFEIHASWIIAATLLNVNLLLVANDAGASIQTAVGGLTLAILLAVGVFAVVEKRNYARVWVVPCVVVWASFAIASELSGPIDTIKDTFSEGTIEHARVASSIVGYVLLLIVTIELLRDRFFSNNDDNVLDSDGESDGNGEYSSLS